MKVGSTILRISISTALSILFEIGIFKQRVGTASEIKQRALLLSSEAADIFLLRVRGGASSQQR